MDSSVEGDEGNAAGGSRRVGRAQLGRWIFLVALALVGLQARPDTTHAAETVMTSVSSELVRLAHANPDEDVQKAIAARQYRFLSVAGYVVETPGVPSTRVADFIVWWYGSRVIPGTSDHAMIPDLQAAAKHYAARYNARLYADLSERNWLARLLR
jgi:hypothetical protein